MEIKSINKLKEMREQVNTELEHIPRGNQSQNELRMMYQINRMRSLGKKAKTKATKEDILLESIDYLKKQHPNFTPQYDTKFFRVKL